MSSLVLRIFTILCFAFVVHPAQAQDATRGAYVAKLADCDACHTMPHKPTYSGGLTFATPFGTIYATNITPDKVFGIGNYSLKEFDQAVRHGISKDGTHLYPAMPYASYAAMSDQDLADLYAYIMTDVQPVATEGPKTKLAFPYNQRWGMVFWNFVFATHNNFEYRHERDASWNRGAYIVETLGHCGACHTPRNLAYAEEGYTDTDRQFMAGTVIDDWYAARLRGDPLTGLGEWSEDDIISFLKTGHGHNATAFGSMQQVIEESGQYFTPGDAQAVAHYLKTIQPYGEKASYRPVQKDDMQRPGAGFYASSCAECHQVSGHGLAEKYPALAGSPEVLAQDPTSLIHIILEGGHTAQTQKGPTSVAMPAFKDKFTDRQLAEIVTFIRSSWGNDAPAVTERTVHTMHSKLEDKPVGKKK